MAKIAKTGDRKKVMDTNKSTDCPKCSKPTRIVKRVKDRERGTPGGVYISCSACDFFEKLSPDDFLKKDKESPIGLSFHVVGGLRRRAIAWP